MHLAKTRVLFISKRYIGALSFIILDRVLFRSQDKFTNWWERDARITKRRIKPRVNITRRWLVICRVTILFPHLAKYAASKRRSIHLEALTRIVIGSWSVGRIGSRKFFVGNNSRSMSIALRTCSSLAARIHSARNVVYEMAWRAARAAQNTVVRRRRSSCASRLVTAKHLGRYKIMLYSRHGQSFVCNIMLWNKLYINMTKVNGYELDILIESRPF